MKNHAAKEVIENWLKFARENLLFARAGMSEDFSPYHTISFLCQSSAEKYLKAFLISHGWELKKIHDLSKLLDECLEFDNSLDSLFPDCELLNDYITEGRYPGDLSFENITQKDAEEAITAAERIEAAILERIKLI